MNIRRQDFIADLIAGLTNAIAGAPQAMGFALIAGISPVYGLYTAVVSTIVGALISSSAHMTIAPTNALALVVFSALSATDASLRMEKLFVLTLLVGVFQLAFGALRLASLIRFVSHAVMTGFITGAAFLIIFGQVANLTGYVRSESLSGPLPEFWDWLTQFQHWDPQTTVLGIVSILIILLLRLTRLKYMAILIAIIATSALTGVLDWEGVRRVADISPIPPGLPDIFIPNLRYAPELIIGAFSLAILGLTQSSAIIEAIPQRNNKIPNMNQDFIAQGAANLIGSIFQSMPSGGSLSRTAINISAGARTRLANLFAAGAIAIILIAFNHLVEQIVLAVLAAQLIIAALLLINPGQIRIVWQVSRSGRFAMIITFFATLVLPLEYSIFVGVLLHLARYIYTSSQNVEVIALEETENRQFHQIPVPARLPDDQPVVLTIEGNLYFAAFDQLTKKMPPPGEAHHPVVILRLRGISYLGTTGVRMLIRYAKKLQAQGGKLILSGVNARIRKQLEQTGAIELIGAENIFEQDDYIFHATHDAIAYARHWLETQNIS